MEIPYFESFEHFRIGDNISSASSNWRLTHGGSDVYQDAMITDLQIGKGYKKSLHIQSHTDITIDLEHIEVTTLIIEFDQFILPGKSFHICLNDINGLQIDMYSNGYMSETYINNALYAEFDVIPNEWNKFRISIQGFNDRVAISCNKKSILTKYWDFSIGLAQIESIVFSRGDQATNTNYKNYESFLDNLSIYDANNRTSVEIVDQDATTINIYPNPADQYVRISGLPIDQQHISLDILNTRGQKVLTSILEDYTNEININTSQFEPGVYYYQVSGKNTTLGTGKILIAR